MKINRRQFLFLSSLSAFGSGLVAGKLTFPHSRSTDFATAATPKQDLILRFVSVADTGTGAKGQYAVARAMTLYHQRNPYDLVVLAGDNIYNNGEISKIKAVFERPYQDLLKRGVKFQACLGNHDIRTENGELQIRYAGFNMNGQRYYTFHRDAFSTKGYANDGHSHRIQFFALDTNSNADWTNQLTWLEKELSSSKAAWKVVFGHHPIYSSGVYGSNPDFIKTFTPLFQKYGVQLYINGHEHSYERTGVIDGTTYLICGAGAGNRPVGRSQWTEYSTSNLSFATYEVYPDRIDLSAIGTNHKVFDRGVISLKPRV